MKVLVFAAGLGTRLRPLTDRMPKALVPVGEKPLLAITLEHLVREGATEAVVNVHHFADQIKAYLQVHDFGIPVRVSDESDRLLDTGGGLRRALTLFQTEPDAPVLIHNVDILSDAPLRQFYTQCSSAQAALLVSNRASSRKLYFDAANRLCAWQNLNTGEVRGCAGTSTLASLTPYAFSGIHLFSPRFAARMEAYGDCFPIMDFYLRESATADIVGYPCQGLRLIDVGKPETLASAEEFLATIRH